MRQPKEVLQQWVEAIQAEGRGVTEWEGKFVQSCAEVLDEGRGLSEKQEEILERVYAQRAA